MKVKVDKEIMNILPTFHVLAYKFPLTIEDSNKDVLKAIEDVEVKCKQLSLEEVINLERIREGRNAYKKFGKDPSRCRIACESLLRRLSKEMGLYVINNAVDVGNLLSIELNRPTAVLDYDKIEGDVCIRMGTQDDVYFGIGRGQINVDRIPVYEDNISPFGSPTSDTVRTSITRETKNILLFVICFGDSYLEESDRITRDFYEKYTNVTSMEKIDVEYER